jgi:hypothetical protein
MRLTRATVTAASRIMLPAYVVLNILVGVFYTLAPTDRLNRIDSLAFQRAVMPMHMWGLVFVALAVVMAGALLSHRRELMTFALFTCAVTWACWSAMYAASLHVNAGASPISPVLAGFVATACVASAVSLLHGEVQ